MSNEQVRGGVVAERFAADAERPGFKVSCAGDVLKAFSPKREWLPGSL